MAKQPRSKFDDLLPLDRDEILRELQRLNDRCAGYEAEVEGKSTDLKETKLKLDAAIHQIRTILSAVNNDRPVYRLKDGTVTTDAPDPQAELPIAN